MRLTPPQVQAIKQIVSTHCGEKARIWLFGSRVDDTARGGDIDLFVEVDQKLPDRGRKQSRIVTDLWKAIGEQKIDLILADPTTRPQPIHDIARNTGIPLQ
jgi:predicted nucleotidyltransferase